MGSSSSTGCTAIGTSLSSASSSGVSPLLASAKINNAASATSTSKANPAATPISRELKVANTVRPYFFGGDEAPLFGAAPGDGSVTSSISGSTSKLSD